MAKDIVRLGFYRARFDKERFSEGTLEELIENHSYTLELGKEYEHEEGSEYVNLDIQSLDDLVDALNASLVNRCQNKAPDDYYFAA